MQRKELKKAIKIYSHKTNFYKLGLVRKLLKFQEKEEEKLLLAIPIVICPECSSRKISIENDDSEYSDYRWLYCERCGETFDDDFGYISASNELSFDIWCDEIAIELHFNNPNIKTEKWKQFCEREIIKVLSK